LNLKLNKTLPCYKDKNKYHPIGKGGKRIMQACFKPRHWLNDRSKRNNRNKTFFHREIIVEELYLNLGLHLETTNLVAVYQFNPH